MGAWNIPSRREDDHLSLLSSEFKRLNIGIAAIFEVQRLDSGEIMVGGYTYYLSGRSDACHAQGVSVAVSNKLTPMISAVTPVNECIMRLRICHCLGVIPLVSVYAPTEAGNLTVKDAFESVVDQCPRQDTLLVLRDFTASTGTGRGGYDTCVGPHGSETVNQNSTKFLVFARSH